MRCVRRPFPSAMPVCLAAIGLLAAGCPSPGGVSATLPKAPAAAAPALHVVDKDGLHGYADPSGNLVVPADLEVARPFKDGVAIAKRGAEVLLVDMAGALVPVQTTVDRIADFDDGLARFAVDLDPPDPGMNDRFTGDPLSEKELSPNRAHIRCGLIDRSGRVVVPAKWGFILPFEGDVARVYLGQDRQTGNDGLRWGLIDRRGEVLLDPVYDRIEPFADGAAVVHRGEYSGLVDAHGKLVLPVDYVSIYGPNEGHVSVWHFTPVGPDGSGAVLRTGYASVAGKLITAMDYDQIGIFQEGLGAVNRGGAYRTSSKWGYVDRTGKEVIAPQFTNFTAFREGLAAVNVGAQYRGDAVTALGKWGYIDAKGAFAIPATFESAQPFAEGVARVATGMTVTPDGYVRGGKWGLVDHAGHAVVPPQYDAIEAFDGGFARVNLGGMFQEHRPVEGGKWGLIDPKGRLVVPVEYELIDQFGPERARMYKDGANAWVDKHGKVLSCGPGTRMGDNSGDRFTFSAGGTLKDNRWEGAKFGICDRDGKVLLPARFDGIELRYNGYAISRLGDLKGLINLDGRELYAPAYRNVQVSDDGTAIISTGEKSGLLFGFADGTGAVFLPPKYQAATPFFGGAGHVVEGGKYDENGYGEGGVWHLVDRKGAFRGEGFAQIDALHDGLSRMVNAAGRMGLVDARGKVVLPAQYTYVDPVRHGVARIATGGEKAPDPEHGKWGLADAQGKILVEPRYDLFFPFFAGVARINVGGKIRDYAPEGGKWGLVDERGRLLTEVGFDLIGIFDDEGTATVRKGDKIGLVDSTGSLIVEPRYSAIGLFHEGLAIAGAGGPVALQPQDAYGSIAAPDRMRTDDQRDASGAFGFIDRSGREVVPPRYAKVMPFAEGMAAVELGDKWGFIDRAGREVIAPAYAEVQPFKDGLALFSPDGKSWGVLRASGQVALEAKYRIAEPPRRGFVTVTRADAPEDQARERTLWIGRDPRGG
jgi:WG containing repeat